MSDEAKLKHYLHSYKNPDATRRDVLNAVQYYKSLSFRLEKFTFNDGNSMDLVNLSGTVPIVYKGSSYNIPICIWLMDTHPTHAPLCFVKPTPDMSINVSKHVDRDGKIYLPELHEWTGGKSNLVSLVRKMIKAFSELPPVYSKPAWSNSAQPRPPYPTSSFMPQPGGGPPGGAPGGYLPYPAYPGAGMPYPGSGPMTHMPTPYGQSAYPGYPPASSANDTPSPPYPTASGTSSDSGFGTITDEHIKASLYSAIEDKLKKRMREQYLQNQAEMDTLRRTQQELNEGKSRLDDILSRLERESAELDRNIATLREKEQELQQSIEKLSEQDSVDPDDAVTTTSPLYNQLLNAFAEEATTEDAIYYMGEALRTGVIDLEVFLKQVRALSRKQFTLRALMQMCRRKANLGY